MPLANWNYARQLFLVYLLLSPIPINWGQSYYGNAIADMLELLRRGQYYKDLEAQDEREKLLNSYDFIVVGAGTAGCALAARLSENPKWKVLLIEAGDAESYIMDVPILTHYLQLGEMNWHYRTEPSDNYCLAMKQKRCNWPRGKVMGGSSVLNYMMYTRGNRRDYDQWAALGNPGWSYKEILPYFRKYEGSLVPDADADFVGRQGPVKITYSEPSSIVADAFISASKQAGLRIGDYNGRIQLGASYLQVTVANETRWSSNRAYLYPIKGQRPNLHVKKNTLVTRVLINRQTKQAYGVIMKPKDGRLQKILATKEVILCAGAINTPQLLMLSGIGPAKHLRSLGIKPLADLAVGFNLQDHIAPGITILTNATTLRAINLLNADQFGEYLRGRGDIRKPGGVESISFYALDEPNNPDGWADMEFFLINGALHANNALSLDVGLTREIYEHMFGSMERADANAFMIFPMILRPKSRGRIKLKSSNALDYPLIYPNYFADPYDLNITVRGIQKAVSLLEQPAFRAINANLLKTKLPGCRQFISQSDEYWSCYARYFTFTIYHYSGTAKMGPKSDPAAVVDARLRVHGIKGLRVVDASIMPNLISGHPNGPIFLIAEKAADMIKEDYNQWNS